MIRRTRAVAVAVGLFTAVGVFGTTSGGVSAAQRNASVVGDYSKMGQDGSRGPRCYNTPDIWIIGYLFRCHGYLKDSIDAIASSRSNEFAALLTSRLWHDSTFVTRRKPAKFSANIAMWPTFKIQAIKHPHRLSYRNVPLNGVLLARIEVAPRSQRDSMYGIDNPTDQPKFFFLVGTPYDTANTETVDTIYGARWQISDWFLLSIEGTGKQARVQKVGKTGRVSWCGHTHEDSMKTKGARFLTCAAQEAVTRVRNSPELIDVLKKHAPSGESESGYGLDWIVAASKKAMAANSTDMLTTLFSPGQIQLLRALVKVDFFSDPVWMTCGVGCCIAET